MISPNSRKGRGLALLFVFVVVLAGSVAIAGQTRLAANPSIASFGDVAVGASKTINQTLTDTDNSSLTISQVNVSGAAFIATGLNLPLTLNAGQSYTFAVKFSPTAAGTLSGQISVVYGHSQRTLTIPLSATGTAVGQLKASPSTLNFGSVMVGSAKSLSATLSASGTPVTVSSSTVNSSEFSLSGVSFPFTLAAGQSASLAVKFVPQSSGAASGSLLFKSNAATSATELLSGSGSTALQHAVTLSWSAASLVAGYNIYRGTQSGGRYGKINPVLDASTAFTDQSVQAGQTYYYVTTSVGASGLESKYSNQVKTVIPNP